jgi:uncharacterized glyoxalase superfamily metalloenzyme YdcJ
MVSEVDSQLTEAPAGPSRVDIARQIWRQNLPATERELALQGLGFFTYRTTGVDWTGSDAASLRDLMHAGVLEPEPIVYEDFLPRSAAGIFQSNLTDEGTRDDELLGTPYDMDRLSHDIGRPIADPTALYRIQRDASLAQAATDLAIRQINID